MKSVIIRCIRGSVRLTTKGKKLVLLTWWELGKVDRDVLERLLSDKMTTWHPRTTVKIGRKHPPSSKMKVKQDGGLYLDTTSSDLHEICAHVNAAFGNARLEMIRKDLAANDLNESCAHVNAAFGNARLEMTRNDLAAKGLVNVAGRELQPDAERFYQRSIHQLEAKIEVILQTLSSVNTQLTMVGDVFNEMRSIPWMSPYPTIRHRLDLCNASLADHWALVRKLVKDLRGLNSPEEKTCQKAR